ncbi:uncharacterized protein [Gossypium hirsutum]|uniref:Uncharacterized protein n=1 Tax=Gossypium hirsutum TaxID=3635 RepID=A0A1U8KI97_GOSHI|nr:uncharacterized protein LOC107917344 [Gossypium hirsutum]
MKEEKTVKQYSDRSMAVVNNIRLLGEQFNEARIVEKVISTLPERYEEKISSLENSRDLTSISLIELINALMHKSKGGPADWKSTKKVPFKPKPSLPRAPLPTKARISGQASLKQMVQEDIHPAHTCRRVSHLGEVCWVRPDVQCRFCKKMGHVKRVCKNKGRPRHNQPQQPRAEAQVVEEDNDQEEQVFAVSCSAAKGKATNGWLIDSGCTNHMTPDAGIFKSIHRRNLLSIAQLIEKGYSVVFKGKKCLISDPSGSKLMTVAMTKKSFIVDWNKSPDSAYTAAADKSKMCHKRLSHANYKSMAQLTKEDLVENLTNSVEKERKLLTLKEVHDMHGDQSSA